MKTLVTGANGFIGSAIVRKLLEEGEEVRVLVRSGSDMRNLEGLKVEIFPGDLRDPLSLRGALRGCGRLFHVAALYSLWVKDPSEIYESNVNGTRNLMESALEEGVDRVVYTSTVGAIGIPEGGKPGNEDTPLSLDKVVGNYKRSKFLAEKEVRTLIQKGLPVVIVNPSTPVGPRDVKPTPTGKIILDFLQGKMWGYMDVGLNLVDVGDVANGHLLASDKGKIGERYILGNRNLMLREFFEILAHLCGGKAPWLKMPYSLVLPLAFLSTGISNFITRRPPQIPIEAVQMAKKKMFFDSSKAIRELGYSPRPIEDALGQAVDWFRKKGYV